MSFADVARDALMQSLIVPLDTQHVRLLTGPPHTPKEPAMPAVDQLVKAEIPEPPAVDGVVIAFDGTPYVRVEPDTDGRDFAAPSRSAAPPPGRILLGPRPPLRASWLELLAQGSVRIVWDPAAPDGSDVQVPTISFDPAAGGFLLLTPDGPRWVPGTQDTPADGDADCDPSRCCDVDGCATEDTPQAQQDPQDAAELLLNAEWSLRREDGGPWEVDAHLVLSKEDARTVLQAFSTLGA